MFIVVMMMLFAPSQAAPIPIGIAPTPIDVAAMTTDVVPAAQMPISNSSSNSSHSMSRAARSAQGTITCGQTRTGSTAGHASSLGGASADHTYTFDVTYSSSFVFNSCGSSYDTWLRVYDARGTQVASGDDDGNCGLQTILATPTLAPGSYTLLVEGYSNREGRYTVAMQCAAAPTLPPSSSSPTTSAPTRAPITPRPSAAPTTSEPTLAPITSSPTAAPVAPPTSEPTQAPMPSPTPSPAPNVWTPLGGDIIGDSGDDLAGTSTSLSADGLTAAYGAPGYGNSHGQVRVYRISSGGTVWTPIGGALNGDADFDKLGSSVSLSGNGNVVAVSAPESRHGGVKTGSVRLYRFNDNGWNQLGPDINGDAADDRFGSSLSLSPDGTTVAVGATTRGVNGVGSNNAGYVKVFRLTSSGTGWFLLGDAIIGGGSDGLGKSVSLSENGNVVAIGAPGAEVVRVLSFDSGSGSWAQLGTDIERNGGKNWGDAFGHSVSLSDDGTTVAAGAWYSGGIAGHVAVCRFSSSSNSWTQLGDDITGAADDLSGCAVSLSAAGTIVAIGAYNNGVSRAGTVRVYGYKSSGSGWTQRGSNINGEHRSSRSGYSVSLSARGTTVAIGAPHADGPQGPSPAFYQGQVTVHGTGDCEACQ